MERYIVDRVEDGIAVLEKEDLTHVEIPVSEIGYEVKEGNVLLFENGKFTLDEAFEADAIAVSGNADHIVMLFEGFEKKVRKTPAKKTAEKAEDKKPAKKTTTKKK